MAWVLIAVMIVGAGVFVALKIKQNKTIAAAPQTKSVYLAFTDDVYDSIQKNYWDKISDSQLTKLYQNASDKLLGKHVALSTPDQAGLETMT